ncbi:MAG: UDP-glucose/GDP-mannose dehydrogenase family protein [Aquificaceae bacterium]|nr:UDP-glucose/GDP-mannose dehydrogenase family protein [Aquificaceae bacterium]MDW8237845.1 UDP-glucose/GDP-mannose dehydrogenase family protein [Aquificaceae bacterium]
MRITVVGAGYVGLTTAACFAHLGHEVMVVEKLRHKVELLNSGKVPIYEPGLEELISQNLSVKRLFLTTEIEQGLDFSSVIFICVGTPENPDGSADLSQVEEVARQCANIKSDYKLLVEKSTVPVNTHKLIKKTLERYSKDTNQSFEVASNPEFLREGSAIEDFLNPDRIVIGVESQRAKEIFLELYKDFNCPIIFTDPSTAELIKHASNSFLATKISFINMIADLCERVGADVKLVADGMGFDKRIGRAFLNAGLGFGGSCFPKDLKAFIKIANSYGLDFGLLREVERINSQRAINFVQKVKDALWNIKGKTLAIWGLSFKPNTDDIREAPSMRVIELLLKEGANLRLYDPKAALNFSRLFPSSERILYLEDKYEALKGACALLIITEWPEFENANLETIKELLELPLIFDGRNIFDPKRMQQLGFEYYAMGR